MRREAENDENTKGPFVVISVDNLKANLMDAYQAERDMDPKLWVALRMIDILSTEKIGGKND